MGKSCRVFGCTGRTPGGGFLRRFRFPKDKKTRCTWVHLSGRKTKLCPEDRICERHFSPEQYAESPQGELLGSPVPRNKRVLKPGAIPDINLPDPERDLTLRKRQASGSKRQVASEKEHSNREILDKNAQEDGTLKQNVDQPSSQLRSGPVTQISYSNHQMTPAVESNMMKLSQLVQEVRELYLGKVHPPRPFVCNAMSPRVILIRMTDKYIEKYTMVGLVKNEPISEDEESWESEWGGQEWDMNILEPLVEITDKPKDNSKKRKRKPNTGESRKRGRIPKVNRANEDDTPSSNVKESEFIDVSIKQEPPEAVPEPLQIEMPRTAPMATIPVGNTTTPTLPVYQVPAAGLTVYVPQPQPLVLQPGINYSVQNTDNLLINQQQNNTNPSTSDKPVEDIHSEVDLAANVKQEEMENVFVMPFGRNLETEDKAPSKKQRTSEPEVIECESPEETARKHRTAAIAASLGAAGTSPHRKLRDLTFKLVELNNKNLQCDVRIDKIKEEFKKRLHVVEIEKKGIEQEIDRVLSSIQDWKDARK